MSGLPAHHGLSSFIGLDTVAREVREMVHSPPTLSPGKLKASPPRVAALVGPFPVADLRLQSHTAHI